MQLVHRLICAVCYGLALGTAASQELASRPELVPGEAWTYEVFDSTFPEGSFTIEVLEKTTDGYSLAAKDVTVKGRVPSSLTIDLNWVLTSSKGSTPSCWLSFPLEMGKTWSCKSEGVSPRGQAVESHITYKVVGKEKVTVRAGSFDAIKVVGEGHWKSGGWSDKSTITYWYSPQVRARVSEQRENWPKTSNQPRMELVRYVRPQ